MVLYGRVFIDQVTSVEPHPQSDTLDIVTIGGQTNVANRPAPDQPRYKTGDYAAVLKENLILPEFLLRDLDLWDEQKQKGRLAGSKGNRTKARNIQGVPSEVALCAATCDPVARFILVAGRTLPFGDGCETPLGRDVGDELEVTVYDPPQGAAKPFRSE
jgi:hypothetical protein